MQKLLLPISIVVAGVIIAGAFVYINQGKVQEPVSEETPSFQEIAEKAIDYINKNKDTLTGGVTASLISVTEEGDVLKIHLMVGEKEYDSYVTKDGKLLFPNSYNLEEVEETEGETPTGEPEAPAGEEFSPEKLEALAKCLSETGAKFYGAFWCGWCNKQKELFGEAAQHLPYVECSDEETRQMLPECQQAGVTSFPTWEFEGEKVSGFKDLEGLAKLSGCPF